MSYCLLGENCVVYDPGADMPGLAETHFLCLGCHEATRNTLNLLRYDYVDLSQIIAKIDARSDGKIFRPKPESAPPINMAVFTLRGDIAWYVGMLAITVRRATGGAPRIHHMPVREGYALDHDVRYLVERVPAIASLPATEAHWLSSMDTPQPYDGRDMVMQLSWLHRAARRLCGTETRTITVPGHCPDCQTPSLRRESDDTDKIWCVHCRIKLSQDEYLAAIRLQLPSLRNPTE